MKQHLVKIKSVKNITHDVLQIVTEKPQQYNFTPGQATEVAINKKGWQNEKDFLLSLILSDKETQNGSGILKADYSNNQLNK